MAYVPLCAVTPTPHCAHIGRPRHHAASRPSLLVPKWRVAQAPRQQLPMTFARAARVRATRGLRMQVIAVAETAAGVDEEAPSRNDGKNDGKTDYIEVAEISSSHGLKGEVRVMPLTDFPVERLESPGKRYLLYPGRRGELEPPRPIKLKRGRSSVSKGHDVYILKFEGINTPEQAAELAGCKVCVISTNKPEIEDEFEYHITDLIGLHAVHLDGTGIGYVIEVYDGTGVYDVLKIELESGEAKGGYALIPFVRDIVPEVDLDEGTMVLDPPAGLLELARPPKKAGTGGKKKGKGRRNDVKELKMRREQEEEKMAEQQQQEEEEEEVDL
eukprot:CAMPEP_0198210364 /NCGR_PEP_ID=MMETSP1445-20131203/20059_1 /TAXON_ID=36898 /ORGANISM="Pyramimonas sp., Strain CCMP2087" /LENGTH=328 /DNA_ID=CAMNT_0043884407 /DNA_START=61 /DNA_END=1047 /DNA_ORIENTATION=+